MLKGTTLMVQGEQQNRRTSNLDAPENENLLSFPT